MRAFLRQSQESVQCLRIPRPCLDSLCATSWQSAPVVVSVAFLARPCARNLCLDASPEVLSPLGLPGDLHCSYPVFVWYPRTICILSFHSGVASGKYNGSDLYPAHLLFDDTDPSTRLFACEISWSCCCHCFWAPFEALSSSVPLA